MADRIAIVTGASSGLGAAIARELVARGKVSAIALVARRADRLEEMSRDLKLIAPRLEVETITADLVEPNAACEVIERTTRRFGGIDLLINNAGLGLPTLFANAPPENLSRQIAVNFTAPLMLGRFAIPCLARRKGMIINIGSAITCIPNSALGAYGATKSGLAYWSEALRREVRPLGISVCLVEPGPIRTEFSTAFRSLSAPGEQPHPVVESPSEWMTADVDQVARRIVKLVDRPKRRLSMKRRIVWPLRWIGGLFRLTPPLGDLVVTRLLKIEQRPKDAAENSE
jgi:short-subunit dehydrogenase